MKHTDLQIGDYVYHKGKIVKVDMLTPSDFNLAVADEDGGNVALYKDIEPIPITPEILEKNGFKNYGKGVFKLNIQGKNKCIEIFFNDDDISLSIINTRIDQLNVRVTFESSYAMINKQLYVHELQHALRLCKIEKEIKL